MNEKLRMSWGVLCVSCMLVGLLIAPACSDDSTDTNNGQGVNATTTNSGTGMECPDGERYNPILARCVPLPKPPVEMDMAVDQSPAQPDQSPEPDMPDMPDTLDMPVTSPDADMTVEPDPDMAVEPDADMAVEPDADMTTEPDMPPVACGTVNITGVACVPSGDALPGARVTVEGIDCATGQPFTRETIASGTGRYELNDVPTGEVTVTLESGSFNRTFFITLSPGVNVDLTQQASKICIETSSVAIAVIKGEFDKVEDILDDLDLTYEFKGTDGGARSIFSSADQAGLNQTKAFLNDLSAMQQYDIIFINCGNLWDALSASERTAIAGNLFMYVNSGKSLYASDWAHMFIERPFASIIDFLGDDADVNQARQGYAPQAIQATVESPGLQAALGTTTVLIDFPHNPPALFNNNWVMVEGVNVAATVHLRGDAQRCGPSMCNAGAMLPGSPLLVTYTGPTGGSLAYTSFHNHGAGTPLSPEISKILKYLIFQL